MIDKLYDYDEENHRIIFSGIEVSVNGFDYICEGSAEFARVERYDGDDGKGWSRDNLEIDELEASLWIDAVEDYETVSEPWNNEDLCKAVLKELHREI